MHTILNTLFICLLACSLVINCAHIVAVDFIFHQFFLFFIFLLSRKVLNAQVFIKSVFEKHNTNQCQTVCKVSGGAAKISAVPHIISHPEQVNTAIYHLISVRNKWHGYASIANHFSLLLLNRLHFKLTIAKVSLPNTKLS